MKISANKPSIHNIQQVMIKQHNPNSNILGTVKTILLLKNSNGLGKNAAGMTSKAPHNEGPINPATAINASLCFSRYFAVNSEFFKVSI